MADDTNEPDMIIAPAPVVAPPNPVSAPPIQGIAAPILVCPNCTHHTVLAKCPVCGTATQTQAKIDSDALAYVADQEAKLRDPAFIKAHQQEFDNIANGLNADGSKPS